MSFSAVLYSTKVFPTTGAALDADEEAQIAKLGALVAPAMQPRSSFRGAGKKARSVDFSTKSGLGTQRSRKNLSSFLSTNEEGEDDTDVNLEMVINFLTLNIENVIADRVYMKDFEELCHELMKGSRDPELHRILKSHGWTGTRFKNSTISPLDMHSVLQDFSNLYLRYKVSVYTTHITSLYEAGNAKATDQIFSFVPDSLLTYLGQQEISLVNSTPKTISPRVPSNSSIEPPASSSQSDVRCATFTGACMLADISGFSKFSGAMCSKGVSGLDDLREATNGFLGHIVKIVYEFHGDVIAFAGDALICVFLDDGTDGQSMKGSREINCCYRALQCANVLKNHKTTSLSAHIGVSYGEMKMALLGGLNEQWVYLMNGECVSQLAACIESAGSQEVSATKACYEKALEFVPPEEKEEEGAATPHYQSLTAGMKKNNKKIDLAVLDEHSSPSKENENKALIRVHDVEDPTIVLVDYIDPRIFHREPTSQFRRMESHFNNTKVKSARTVQFQADEDRDRQKVIENAALFVPRPILSAIHSEALDHIGELRHVTTMFVSLDSYSHELNSDPCTLQPFFLMAQKILQEAGGFLRQFLVDDKGCVFIAMWGMPSFTYSNNASRALYCGVAVSMGVAALGHKVSIGISTGNVFCGTVGAPERRDYAGIGTDVNMAARLMGKAHGRVLLDVKTYHNLNEKTRRLLVPAEEMKLKGNDVPVTPYKYDAETIPPMEGAEDHHDHAILRRPVKTILGIQIDKIANTVAATAEVSHKKYSYFTLVIGPPGTGKSTAVEYFRHSARKRNVPCIFIKARPGHEGVPYGLMRELFLELVGDHNFRTEEQQKSGIYSLIEAAYANKSTEEKRKAMFSLEIVLGVEWGKSNRKVGSFTDVVTDLVHQNRSAKQNKYTPGEGDNASVGGGAEGESSKDETGDKLAASAFDGMLFDSSMTHLRPPGDMSFYNVLHMLLRNRRVAIIIEDAHFCDELSWCELNLILNGRELEVSVLMTMRSNAVKAASAAAAAGSTIHNTLSFNSPTAPGSFSQHSVVGDLASNPSMNMSMHSNGSNSGSIVVNTQASIVAGGGGRSVHVPHRNSVLVNAISNSISVSRSISIDSASPKNNHQPSGIILSPTGSSNGPGTEATRLGLKAQSSPALLSILSHERATVLEMTGLGEPEVREVLLHTLKVDHVSQNLIKLVFDVSSGNAYWCKAIANFIKERGVKELEDAIQKGDSPHNALKVLILMRMEKLEVDHQLVLKNAAIIGDEFSERMLHHVLPARIQATLLESLDLLAEHGFIFCVEEHPECIFAFQNDLIRETLYELMPPRDSAHVHLMVAQFIEEQYAGNLRPFYPMLGLHYSKSIGNRNHAFKYQLKASDQAISRGAFSDGLIFLEAAAKLAVTKPELKVLSDVIARALRDISPLSNAKLASSARKVTHKAFGGTTEQPNAKTAAYTALQVKTQAQLDRFARNTSANVLGAKGPGEMRLTWQPSYVASRMNENSESDEDTPPLKSKQSTRGGDAKEKKKPTGGGGMCSIS